ncbi:MAG: thioredoxin family protein [Cyanophyceae cyanobacterium]
MERLDNRLRDRIGQYAHDFEIPGVAGQVQHLATLLESHRAIAMVFMCNHCPFVRSYLSRLMALQAEFSPQGITLLGINPNDPNKSLDDDFEAMKRFAAEQKLNFPYLWDSTQDVARSFQAEFTPQVFVVDSHFVLRYIGAIDDEPQSPDAVTEPYLRQALQAIVDGKPVSTTFSEATGCSIKWRR